MRPFVPLPGPQVPRVHGPVVAAIGRFVLRVIGWRFEGALPDVPRMMMIVAPHTSNWDVPVGLAAKFALRIECRFLAKRSLFWWPLGVFLRAMGGLAIDRSAAGDVVGAACAQFGRVDKLVLIITPEGTRSRVAQWKSGFHRIARAAGVPIVLVTFDYGRRVIRLGPSFEASSDYEGDLAQIQSRLHASMARRPECYGQ